jgi:hypothetical protein
MLVRFDITITVLTKYTMVLLSGAAEAAMDAAMATQQKPRNVQRSVGSDDSSALQPAPISSQGFLPLERTGTTTAILSSSHNEPGAVQG